MTGIKMAWWSENGYLEYKGYLIGVYYIPFKGTGHCPVLKLGMSYVETEKETKKMESKNLTHKQFRYLIRKFKKMIRAKGYEDFVLTFSFSFITEHTPINKNLYKINVALHRLGLDISLSDWRDRDMEITPQFKILKQRKYGGYR